MNLICVPMRTTTTASGWMDSWVNLDCVEQVWEFTATQTAARMPSGRIEMLGLPLSEFLARVGAEHAYIRATHCRACELKKALTPGLEDAS